MNAQARDRVGWPAMALNAVGVALCLGAVAAGWHGLEREAIALAAGALGWHYGWLVGMCAGRAS
jgi:hypothetical protein